MARAKTTRKMKTHMRTHNGGTHKLQSDLKKLKTVLGQATRHARGNARKVINDSYGNILDKSSDMQETVVTYTKKQPIKSLGYAMLAGLAIGFLLRK
jgi:ElaB/YqjD/DUF883 family membrane-anchored ribosome-binding protein